MSQKSSMLLAMLVWTTLFAADPSSDLSSLVGKWNGRVEKNLKVVELGGNPSQGETGTPVTIQFTQTPEGLSGQSRSGQDTENWSIKGDSYVWNDTLIEVTTERVGFSTLPDWIKSELGLKAPDRVFAYKFKNCQVVKTKAACVDGKDLPLDMRKTAHWIFKVEANQLFSHVIYKYPNGSKRVLVESLKKE